MSKDNPDFKPEEVTKDDYQDMIESPDSTLATLNSTRGGITSDLNRLEHLSYGAKSIFSSELGMSIQSSPFVIEVLELLATLYDMGNVQASAFKTQESKEQSVSGHFMSFLGISSPAPFRQEGPVRKLLVPMMKTAFARRAVVIYSDAKEEFENDFVPESPAENRRIKAESRVIVNEYTKDIDNRILKAVESCNEDSSVMFDEEAAVIYDDYKSYTEALGKRLLLSDGDSTTGIEMSGKAFKMGRIAALWALASDTRIISKEILIGAIYFVDHGSRHLERFLQTLELKDYELFTQDWQNGYFGNVLPVHKAITKGYITAKQVSKQALESFLKPVNSALQGEATVSYNDKENSFIFLPVIRNTDSEYSYRAVQGHVQERPIHTKHEHKTEEALKGLLGVQSSFNPFVEDTTKFIVLSVKDSFLSMDMINRYLSHIKHYIATGEDKDDRHTFTLIMPVNSIIKKSEYKFIAMSIAQQLLLKVLPETCEEGMLYYGYSEADVLTADNTAILFDVSGILGNAASGEEIPLLTTKAKVKPTAAAIAKYVKEDIMANKTLIVDMLNTSSIKLILFASLVYDLKMHYVPDDKILDIVDSINSELEESIVEEQKVRYLITPFEGV